MKNTIKLLLFIALFFSLKASTFAAYEWEQINTDGFGDANNKEFLGNIVYNGKLYIGTNNYTDGAEVWSYDGSNWTQVNIDGFGDSANILVFALAEYNGELYAGTYDYPSSTGGEVWRYNGGTSWTKVSTDGFGNSNNKRITDMIEYNGYLYASTYNTVDGSEVWKYDEATWTSVTTNGFEDTNNTDIYLEEYNGNLYLSLSNSVSGSVVCILNGSNCTNISDFGFGDTNNTIAASFFSDIGNLYAGTTNTVTGAEVWKYDNGTTWSQLNSDAFGDSNNSSIFSITDYYNNKFASTYNSNSGTEIWKYTNSNWNQTNIDGFGEINNRFSKLITYDEQLYAGTGNASTGTEVWRLKKSDLELTQSVSDSTPQEEDSITITLTLTNNGSDHATNVTITDLLPTGLTYSSDTPSQGTYVSGTGVWTVGTVNSGNSATLQIVADVDTNTATQTISNKAEVTASDQFDPDSTPNNDNEDEDDQETVDISVVNIVGYFEQVSTAGFGSTNVHRITSLTNFNNKLYATTGAYNEPTGAQVWEYDGSTWTQVNTNGFGDDNNDSIFDEAIIHDNELYFSTYNTVSGSEIWKYDGSSFTQFPTTVIGSSSDESWSQLVSLNGDLFSAQKHPDGAKIYKLDGNDFVQINTTGFDDPTNNTIPTELFTHNNDLLVCVKNSNTGLEIWKYISGTNWTQINTDGFGDSKNVDCRNVLSHNDNLYIGTVNTTTGGEIWLYDGTTWTQINTDGFGDADNITTRPFVFNDVIISGVGNNNTGSSVWAYSGAGTTWSSINTGGFGNTNNLDARSAANFNNELYIGGWNYIDGAEIWRLRESDLSLTQTISNSAPNEGDTITYTITVTNEGPDDATNVTITDTWPTGVTYSSDSPSQGSYVSGTGVWTVGTIASGSSATLEITATVDANTAVTTITNKAEVTASDQYDFNSTPNNDDEDEDDQENLSIIPINTDGDWIQVSQNGFDEIGKNEEIVSSIVYNGKLILGTHDNSPGAEVWQYDGTTWTQINTNGFGDANNIWISALAIYNGELYAGTYDDPLTTGGEVWRYNGGTSWTKVSTDGFGNANNSLIRDLDVYNNELYASVEPLPPHGGVPSSVWKYNGSTWTQFGPDYFGDVNNTAIRDSEINEGKIYFSLKNNTTGVEIWEYDGTTLSQVNIDAFGEINNSSALLFSFNNKLYAGARNDTLGARIYRYDGGTTWTPISSFGFDGDTNNIITYFGVDYNNYLIVGTFNQTSGTEIWKYDGNSWEQINNDGFGGGSSYRHTAGGVILYNNKVYTGVANIPNGAEVWKLRSSDLSLDSSVLPSNPNEGDTILYTISLTNDEEIDAANVQVDFNIPGGLSYGTYSATQGTYNSESGVWDVGTVAQGATLTLDVSASIPTGKAGQTISAESEVIAVNQLDPDSKPNNGNILEDDYSSVDINVLASGGAPTGGTSGGSTSTSTTSESTVTSEADSEEPTSTVQPEYTPPETTTETTETPVVGPPLVEEKAETSSYTFSYGIPATITPTPSTPAPAPAPGTTTSTIKSVVQTYEPETEPAPAPKSEFAENLDSLIETSFTETSSSVSEQIETTVYNSLSTGTTVDVSPEQSIEITDLSNTELVFTPSLTSDQLTALRKQAEEDGVSLIEFNETSDLDGDGVSDILILSEDLPLFADNNDRDNFSNSQEYFLGYSLQEFNEIPTEPFIANLDGKIVGPLPSIRIGGPAGLEVKIMTIAKDDVENLNGTIEFDEEDLIEIGTAQIGENYMEEITPDFPLEDNEYYGFVIWSPEEQTFDEDGEDIEELVSEAVMFEVNAEKTFEAPEIEVTEVSVLSEARTNLIAYDYSHASILNIDFNHSTQNFDLNIKCDNFVLSSLVKTTMRMWEQSTGYNNIISFYNSWDLVDCRRLRVSNMVDKIFRLSEKTVNTAFAAEIYNDAYNEEEGETANLAINVKTRPGAIVYVSWKSIVFSSVILSDASQGTAYIKIPEQLPAGAHEVVVYAYDPVEQITSSSRRALVRR
ncbi:DUF11 domain-containing protein [Candidatus Peregrinibacteria bacterium]|nr:DUF11 domain-containing protein [Candidatus Peregrinibacteria bacterium]